MLIMSANQLQISICEETENKLRNFLTQEHHIDGETMHFVILGGHCVSATITCSELPFRNFFIEAIFVSTVEKLENCFPEHPFEKKDGFEIIKNFISPSGVVKVMHNPEKKPKKKLKLEFKVVLEKQTEDRVRLTMLIAMNRKTNTFQPIKRVFNLITMRLKAFCQRMVI